MKKNEIVVGLLYLTRIGGELARVKVLAVVPRRPGAFHPSDRKDRFRVVRAQADGSEVGEPLPKPRSAAALRPCPTPKAKPTVHTFAYTWQVESPNEVDGKKYASVKDALSALEECIGEPLHVVALPSGVREVYETAYKECPVARILPQAQP
jgi:hypothetical protein